MNVDWTPDITTYGKYWGNTDLSFMQHWGWGEVKKGQFSPERLLVDDIAVQILNRKVALFGTYGYVPMCFSRETLPSPSNLFTLGKQMADRYKLISVSFEPELVDDSWVSDEWKEAGFEISEKTIRPRHTRYINVNESDESLKSSMAKDVRRRLARAEGTNLVFLEDTSEAGVQRLHRSLREVSERKNFDLPPLSYFLRIYHEFIASDMVKIYFINDGTDDLYALMAIIDRRILRRFFGGPSAKGRTSDAAQLMTWKIIEEARRLKCETVDLWGVAPRENEQYVSDHPLSGVSKFKETLGGRHISYYPLLTVVSQPVVYKALQLAKRLKTR